MNDRTILNDQPLPVARLYRRFLNAGQSRDRHDHAYFLFELYLKYVASTAIASYLAGERRDHRVNAALKGLARPSLGEWLRFLRECLEFLGSEPEADPALAALRALFLGREARWEKLVALQNALISFRTGGECRKKAAGLEGLLAEIVAYRNRVLGHGAPLSEGHYREFAGLLAAGFAELLEASPFLTARRLVCFDSIQVREGSRVECQVMEFMGLVPTRRASPHAIAYGEAPPREDALHLLSDDGRLLSLDPLLVAHQEDVFFLNEASGSPEYLSYSTGEHYRPSSLRTKEGELFEKVLGYQVGSPGLKEIEEDLAAAETVQTPPASPGERRLGDYLIIREVGRGGMGAVFEAVQESLGRRVALKVLPGTFALDPKRVERFRREARATARIHHPHIVPVYEVGEASGTHYYAMEFIAGLSLDKLVAEERARREAASGGSGKRRGSITARDSAYITAAVEQMAAVAEGLAEAHREGLVHRDVKPSNILVGAGGRWVLVDFGLVHDVGAEALTRSGEMVGTLRYMSPEQVSRGAVDARADVYSLGVSLYEALTLQPPFEGKSDHEMQRAILFEELVPPRKINPSIARELETVILHALEKNPQSRYPSAAEFAADLRRYLAGEPVLARPHPSWELVLRRAWRRRWPLLGAASFLLAVALALSWPQRPEKAASELPPSRRLFTMNGSIYEPTLSPDGRRVAFIKDMGGVSQVWVKGLEGGEATRVTPADVHASRPRWCPTSDVILFTRVEGPVSSIWSIPAGGGEPRRLVEKGFNPSWANDGKRFVYEDGHDVWTANADGSGTARVESVPPLRFVLTPRYPAFSPDGSRLAFYQPVDVFLGDILVVDRAGGPAVQLTEDRCPAQGPSWMPDGRSIVFTSERKGSQTLWKVPSAGGLPAALTTGAGEDTDPVVFPDGRKLIYTNTRKTFMLRIKDLKTGKEREVLRQRQMINFPRFSPDGDRISFQSSLENEQRVYVVDADGGSPARLIGPPRGETDCLPFWSPDGEHLYFWQMVPHPCLRKVSLRGGDGSSMLDGLKWLYAWADQVDPQDRQLALTVFEPDGRTLARLKDVQTGAEKDLGAPVWAMRWSHDGRRLVGVMYPPGEGFDARTFLHIATVVLVPLDGSSIRSLTQGASGIFSGDDSRIYFNRGGLRGPGLFSITPEGTDERFITDLEKMAPGSNSDISSKDELVWTQVEEADREIWLLDLAP